ncbi:DUF4350 domain-containing protein [Nocardioides humilatus]|uniref:DUF4350 domain-containing protein n=1 Tax=Nocardioides humilatus TaxID=2607660 RepID=A0A5B1LHG8_9ACTN|nr:DUF4350 domain-containing protein [Nocardioides humilatus]KAA1419067.1 DUF4350 domain-containing protein [Nocardioides humilatus]
MSFVRRHRLWIGVVTAVLVAITISIWASSGDQSRTRPLDPDNPDPDGAQALARVLEDRGVEVDVARSADELHAAGAGDGTTVLVTGTDQLAPSTLDRLQRDTRGAEVVLVQPPPYLLDAVQTGLDTSIAADETTGDCADDRFDGLTLTVDRAEAYATSTGCFASRGGYVLARGPGETTYFGADQALTNDQVLRGDNAAVALRLLGTHDRLVWYLPTFDDAAADETVSLWSFAPRWLVPSLWLGFFAIVAVMWWRGRRLGRLAVEPLPVVVRAVETTRSRGRLYRQVDDRAYATSALRSAARRRLAEHLRLGRGATEAEVITAVARHVGRREDEIGALLAHHAPAPLHDQDLVGLAQTLTQLDTEVRRG